MKKIWKKIEDEVAFINSLKHNDPGAWDLCLQMHENTMRHNIYTYRGVYGATAMKSSGFTDEECIQIMTLAVVEAVQRYDLEYNGGTTSRQNEIKRFMQYTNYYTRNALRRAIEEANGVTKQYAWYYVHMRKDGLDLYESPMEDLCRSLSTVSHPPKDPQKVIRKMRTVFDVEKVPIFKRPETPVETMEDAEFRANLQLVKGKLRNQDYNIFYDYYVSGEGHTLKSLSLKYKIPTQSVRESLEVGREAAKMVYGKTPDGVAEKQNGSFANNNADWLELL